MLAGLPVLGDARLKLAHTSGHDEHRVVSPHCRAGTSGTQELVRGGDARWAGKSSRALGSPRHLCKAPGHTLQVYKFTDSLAAMHRGLISQLNLRLVS